MYHRHLGARAQQLEPVEIRKVVDLIQGEDAIPLAAGWPNPESFPVAEIGDLVQDGLDEYGAEMLQYGVTRGNDRLRTAIADRLETRFNVTARPEEIMITSGSQQALYLLSRALLEDDDLMVGVRSLALARGTQPGGVTADDDERCHGRRVEGNGVKDTPGV